METDLEKKERIKKRKKRSFEKRLKHPLTDKEKLVFKMICQEKTTLEMANELDRSLRTIENIRGVINKKTGCNTGISLFKYALFNGIYTIESKEEWMASNVRSVNG
ncbi:MAG: hypothetical protein JKY09_07130 [Crocinitomicaceae bacterium]|nr:hypothetical protein [Crocinitomicaceae bacterium]